MTTIMNRAVYLGGVKGVGKTALLKSLKNRIAYTIVDPPSEMLEYVTSDARDQLDELSATDRISARSRAFERILSAQYFQEIIIDGHFSLSTDYGHEWAIPKNSISRLGPFILITADPARILERRIKDDDRQRDVSNLAEIRLDMEIERLYAIFVSEVTGRPLYIVENNDFATARGLLLRVLSNLIKQGNHE